MTNEQAALIAAATYLGSVNRRADFDTETVEAHSLRICNLAKELTAVLASGGLRRSSGR